MSRFQNNSKMIHDFNFVLDDLQLYEEVMKLSQDKRNKKVQITDVAVSKIPYVRYPDTSIDESIIIHELAEKVLLMSKNENNGNEVTITYDLDCDDKSLENIYDNIGVCFGDEHEIDLFRDTKTYSILNRAKNIAVVNLHNHPNCSLFSIYDIVFFLTYDVLKLMVLISNKGELYYLNKSEKYNRVKNAIAFRELIKKNSPNGFENGKIVMGKISEDEMMKIAQDYLCCCESLGVNIKHIISNDREVEKKYDKRKRSKKYR